MFLPRFSFVLLLLLAFLLQSWKCIDHYLAKETSVKMAVKAASLTKFPSIGISVGWNRTVLGQTG